MDGKRELEKVNPGAWYLNNCMEHATRSDVVKLAEEEEYRRMWMP